MPLVNFFPKGFFRVLFVLIKVAFHPIRSIKSKARALEYLKINDLWRNGDFVLNNIENASHTLISDYPSCSEVEHQVGRFLNMKQLTIEIEQLNIPGDVVEFGTWRGLGLLLLSKSFSPHKLSRQYIGIDSFEGLPETSTIWTKGKFSNTSFEISYQNIAKNIDPGCKFFLIKGWFSDLAVAAKLYNKTRDIVMVHFDADLGSSTTEALKIIEYYLEGLTHPVYFLFDDWGCHPDEVPDAFYEWLNRPDIRNKIKAEKVSSTRFTRYFRVTPVK